MSDVTGSMQPDAQEFEFTIEDGQTLDTSVEVGEIVAASAVTVQPVEANIASPEEIISVEVVAVGPTGERGPAGPPGDSENAISYRHSQMTPAKTWLVQHNLNFFPGGITVQDGAGTICEGEVTYLDSNNLRIMFSAAFSGVAYLS